MRTAAGGHSVNQQRVIRKALPYLRAAPPSGADHPEMERDLSESTRLPRLPGISERDAALLAGRYFDGLTHKELAERFNLTPGSCRVILTRLRRRLVNTFTVSESC